MIAKVLSSMGGVEIYGIISICIFFAVFTGMLCWSLRLKPSYLTTMSHLPLETESDPESTPESPYE